PPPGEGPRGTSGSVHFDVVEVAQIAAQPGDAGLSRATVTARTRGVAVGGYVELTALDTGRTIVALVVGAPESAKAAIEVSPAAAAQLGGAVPLAIRARAVMPSPQDQLALRSGQTAAQRMDAPSALLVALRHRLPSRTADDVKSASATHTPSLPPKRMVSQIPSPTPRATSVPPVGKAVPPAKRGNYFVQVAALGSEARARALLAQLGGGRVTPGGAVFRVQIGPFASIAQANRARDDAARHGYAGGRVVSTN
ncbi:MAG: SPOR domain-containing protein, partial [Pseudomonadota bacterium]|nr:SPOR domain-containing protein [Pseudomonadota bacterium]